MHMADALLSAAAGGTMCAVSASLLGYSAAKIKRDEFAEMKIPVMAVSGAFVFAAQMINFTIPGTGSSGHIGGGILLASLLGGYPALLAISAVLIIQCLFFADGGLLALGCNIFNMGVIPCLIVYPLVFKQMLKKKFSAPVITAASIAAVVLSLQLGAFGVVLETQASGISELPFRTFMLLMLPIHLAIGVIEGAVTAGALCFVYKMRPELLESANLYRPAKKSASPRYVILAMAAAAIITAGLAVFASANPDGLEWSIEKITGATELEVKDPLLQNAAKVQDATALMPDYDFKPGDNTPAYPGAPLAGIAGGVMTFALAGGTALLISAYKKRNKRGVSASV